MRNWQAQPRGALVLGNGSIDHQATCNISHILSVAYVPIHSLASKNVAGGKEMVMFPVPPFMLKILYKKKEKKTKQTLQTENITK